jgi:nucleoside-diphosphate-sugar epimerase
MSLTFIFGLGYCGFRLACKLKARGQAIIGTGGRRPTAYPGEAIPFDDRHGVEAALARATYVVSTVPPSDSGSDPVLQTYGESLRARGAWTCYLSSTGVYGDTGGAWVDESAPVNPGRASARAAAERAWQEAFPEGTILRLPGIYGPGRSALSRAREGRSFAVDAPGHVFSRVHVDDIVAALLLARDCGATGLFNIADDEPASGAEVALLAHRLLGLPPPILRPLEEAALTPAGRRFYAECRRVSNVKARRLLGFGAAYPTFRQGLRACLAEELATNPGAG